MSSDASNNHALVMDDTLRRRLQQIRHLVLDLDGTLYLGGTLFDFTRPMLNTLKKMGVGYTFFTNNSSRSTRQYITHLRDMGIAADADMIYSSTSATLAYLRESHPKVRRIFLVGTTSLRQEFAEAGYINSPSNPQVVVVGFDTALRYERLARAAYWISQGKPFIATHPDLTCPTDQPMVLPDCGAICQLLTAATGRKPDAVLGKPNVAMLNGVLERHHLTHDQVAMVGDRLYTDIAMAHNAGVLGVLVLTGETTPEMADAAKPPPGLILQNAGQLAELLQTAQEKVGAKR